MLKSYIIINATALDRGGGLTILKQFIDAVPEDKFNYLFFVPPTISIKNSQSNISIVTMDVKSFFKRFMWDAFGLKKYLKKNNITPIAAISLQNTNFRVGCKIPNYIYYHQPIPFYDIFWSPLKNHQRIMWFYKHIYPFFVKQFINSRTEIFVQLNFIKAGFIKKFNFLPNKVYVITPNINIPNKDRVSKVELELDKINLFYPAMPYFYKNHGIIIDAISKLKNPNVVLYLTCHREDIAKDCGHLDIRFMGSIPFEKVLGMYSQADAMLFPSYIETYGLPLIEGASFGIRILAADLPYSREVLNGYEGVEFIDYSDSNEWASSIEKLKKEKKHRLYTLSETKSWQELFRIVKQNL